MKTKRRSSESASVLVVGLVITAILVFSLLSYLSLIQRQHVSVARSQAWNAALALSEAGVEEALAKLNIPGAGKTNMLAGGNWSLNNGFYRPDSGLRNLMGGYYATQHTPASPPTIYATGYATIPAISATIRRAVEVKTVTTPLFALGIIAKSNITLHGNAIFSNSFNSDDPNHSNGGQYDPATALNGGDVASAYGIVDVGNRDIYGTLYLGPTASVQGNGQIYGGIVNDFNMDFPDAVPPYSAGSTPSSVRIGQGKNAVDYDYLLQTGYNYYVNAANAGNKAVYVEGSNTVLYITGSVSFSRIDFASPSSSVTIYVGGANASFSDVNNLGTARQLQYFGLPGNTSITLGGNNAFVGTIYAPSASMTLNGGGSSSIDIRGAVIVKNITSNGNFQIHFDEALKTNGPPRGFVAISWREIAP